MDPGPDPHQCDNLDPDPDPHRFADDKPKWYLWNMSTFQSFLPKSSSLPCQIAIRVRFDAHTDIFLCFNANFLRYNCVKRSVVNGKRHKCSVLLSMVSTVSLIA